MTTPNRATPAAIRPDSVAAGYDAVAQEYANHIFHELDDKPFDRAFLERFAAALPKAGLVLDLGCGPGHVGRFLAKRGRRVCGVDMSARMIELARRLNPQLTFEQGDLRALTQKSASADAVIAFYSIIHLQPDELCSAFAEMQRVLKPGGLLAIAFHVGDTLVRVDELWGVKTQLDFRYFEPAHIVQTLQSCGLAAIECSEREPYAAPVEAQTRRCYIVAQRPAPLHVLS